MSRRADFAFRGIDRMVKAEGPGIRNDMEKCSTISFMTLLFESSQDSNMSIVCEAESDGGCARRRAIRC